MEAIQAKLDNLLDQQKKEILNKNKDWGDVPWTRAGWSWVQTIPQEWWQQQKDGEPTEINQMKDQLRVFQETLDKLNEQVRKSDAGLKGLKEDHEKRLGRK